MGIGERRAGKRGKGGGGEYLAIFEGLERVKREGVEQFLKKYPDSFQWGEEEWFSKLAEIGQGDSPLQLERSFSTILKVVVLGGFLLGIVVAISILSPGRVHINQYLLLFIGPPFLFTLWSGWKTILFLLGKRGHPTSYIGTLFEKWLGRGKIIQLYTSQALQLGAIFYLYGFVLGALGVFLLKRVHFYYESSFNFLTPATEQAILNFFSQFYAPIYPYPPQVSHLEGEPIIVFVLEIGLLLIGVPRILFWLLFQLRFNREVEELILTHPTYRELVEKARETGVVSSQGNQEFKIVLNPSQDPQPHSPISGEKGREGNGDSLERDRGSGGEEPQNPQQPSQDSFKNLTDTPPEPSLEMGAAKTSAQKGEEGGQKSHSPNGEEEISFPPNPKKPLPLHLLLYQLDQEEDPLLLKLFSNWNGPVEFHRFNYFGQPEEEIWKLLNSLKGRVGIVIQAERDIAPNQEFREYLEGILKNRNVDGIWLILWEGEGLATRFSYPNFEVWERFAHHYPTVELYRKGRV